MRWHLGPVSLLFRRREAPGSACICIRYFIHDGEGTTFGKVVRYMQIKGQDPVKSVIFYCLLFSASVPDLRI